MWSVFDGYNSCSVLNVCMWLVIFSVMRTCSGRNVSSEMLFVFCLFQNWKQLKLADWQCFGFIYLFIYWNNYSVSSLLVFGFWLMLIQIHSCGFDDNCNSFHYTVECVCLTYFVDQMFVLNGMVQTLKLNSGIYFMDLVFFFLSF